MNPQDPFIAASEYTFDPYWQEILISCSKGKFPKNVRYDPETKTLYVRHASSHVITLTENPGENLKILIKIFGELGMHSTRDINNVKRTLDDGSEYPIDCEWKDIKVKAIRDYILAQFIDDYWTEETPAKQLLPKVAALTAGLRLKTIVPGDFEYENGTIHNINCNPIEIFDEDIEVSQPKHSTTNDKSSFVKLTARWIKKVSSES